MEFPKRFRTRRLLLTRIERGDLDDLMSMHSDPRAGEALGGTRPDNIAALIDELARDWKRHGYGWWVARDPDSGRFLGRGGLRPVMVDAVPETELSYGFLPECWGRGFAAELARVAVAQGFVRIGLREVVSFALPGDQAARRVVEKIGFTCERNFVYAGRPHVLYRLTVDAWRLAPVTRPPTQRRAAELQAG